MLLFMTFINWTNPKLQHNKLKTVRKFYNFAIVQHILHSLIKRNQEPVWRERGEKEVKHFKYEV